MASQDKRISSLAEWVYESVEGVANMVVAYAGSNYRIALSTLKRYVLGNREIGGTGSRDIVTTTDKQTLIEKRLDSPSFNDNTKLHWDVTATQMNFLSGLNVNVNNMLNSIGSDITGIENNVEGLYSTVGALQADKIYSVSHPAISTSITLTALEIGGGKEIDAHSLSISVYMETSPLSMQLVNLSNINISYAIGTSQGSTLTNVKIGDVQNGKVYRIIIRYRVIA